MPALVLSLAVGSCLAAATALPLGATRAAAATAPTVSARPTVPAVGGFSLSAGPDNASVAPGRPATLRILIRRDAGFTAPIMLRAAGGPGIEATFLANPMRTLTEATVSADPSVSPGRYTVSISGSARGRTRDAQVTIFVTAPVISAALTTATPASPRAPAAPLPSATSAPPTTAHPTSSVSASTTVPAPADYTLSVNTASVVVPSGDTAQVSVAIARTGGFDQQVLFSVSGLPPGAGATFDPDSTAGNSTLLTLHAGTAGGGTYRLVIRSRDRTVTVNMTITSIA